MNVRLAVISIISLEKNDIELLAEEYHIGITAEIPIDPSLAKVCDEGRIEDYETDCLENLIEKF